MQVNWSEGIWPTSYGHGPFHPAFHNGTAVWYWPNITFATEDEAYEWAIHSLYGALDGAIKSIAEWNVYRTGR